MTTRARPDNPAGGGDPAGQPDPVAALAHLVKNPGPPPAGLDPYGFELAARWAVIARRATLSPLQARALAFAAMASAAEAFNRGMRVDEARRREARTTEILRKQRHRDRLKATAGLTGPERDFVLTFYGAIDATALRLARQGKTLVLRDPSSPGGWLPVRRTVGGNRTNAATAAFVDHLALWWRLITATPARRRTNGDFVGKGGLTRAGISDAENFILLAAKALAAEAGSGRAGKLAHLTPHAVAERLRQRRRVRK